MSPAGWHAHVHKTTTDKLEEVMNEQLGDMDDPLLFHTGGRDWVLVIWHRHSQQHKEGATA